MGDIKETKLLIKSVLGSSPNQMNLRELLKTFHDMMGHAIPFTKHGYSNVEDFLRSMPDTIILSGTGLYAYVTPVLSQGSEHIVQMIARQRSTHKRGYMHKPKNLAIIARPHPGQLAPHGHHQQQQRPQHVQYQQPPPQHRIPPLMALSPFPMAMRPRPMPMRPAHFHNQQRHHLHGPPPQQQYRQQQRREHSLPSSSPHSQRQSASPSTSPPTPRQVAQVAPAKPVTPPPVQMQTVQDVEKELQSSACSTATETSLDHSINYKIPHAIQENLKQLIRAFPNGIWLRKLPEEYRKMHNTSLEFTMYGYGSLVQMCCSLDYIFKYRQLRKDDGKLYDVNGVIPDDIDLLHVVDALTLEDSMVLYEEKVPAVPADIPKAGEPEYPPYVLLPGEEIPIVQLPDNGELYFAILVGEVYDLSKFWFLLEENDALLIALQNKMEKFYNEHYTKYKIVSERLERGLYCVLYKNGEYTRGIVVKLLPRNMVKIFCIDTGTTDCTHSDNIYFIHRKFTDLPKQALRGRLARLVPVVKGAQWSRDAGYRFLELVKDKTIFASIDYTDDTQGDLIFDLVLCDSAHEHDIFLHDCLIAEGHAVMDVQEQKEPQHALFDDYVPIVDNLHMFPTFIELEVAAVPTALEMRRLIAARMPLYEIYPIYFVKKDGAAGATSVEEIENPLRKFLERTKMAREPETDDDSRHVTNASLVDASSPPLDGDNDDFDDAKTSITDVSNVSSVWTVPPAPLRPPPGFNVLPVMPPYPLPPPAPPVHPYYNWMPMGNNMPYNHTNMNNAINMNMFPNQYGYYPPNAAYLMCQQAEYALNFSQRQPSQQALMPPPIPMPPAKPATDLNGTKTTKAEIAPETKPTRVTTAKKYVTNADVAGKSIHVVLIMSVPCIIPAEIQFIFTKKVDLVYLRRFLNMSDITLCQLRLDSINEVFRKELLDNKLVVEGQEMLEHTSLNSLEELISCILNEEYVIPGFENMVANFGSKSPLWDA